MQVLVRCCAATLMMFLASVASAEDAKPAAGPARMAAARDLMEVTGVTKQLEGMMNAMKQGIAKGADADASGAGKKMSEEIDSVMAKLMNYKEDMITDFAELYAENFTADEMKSVADFYRSGIGAKFIAMTPALMQKGTEIGMKYSQKVMEDLKSESAPAKP